MARQVLAGQAGVDATVSSVSAIARKGTVRQSNTGHPCTSGRELRIRLVGSFPEITTTGHAVLPGDPTPDFTIEAIIVTADAVSGRACLIGVADGEDGQVGPLPGGTELRLGPDVPVVVR